MDNSKDKTPSGSVAKQETGNLSLSIVISLCTIINNNIIFTVI